MPYKFNGKEFDEETGLYYYGARYMNPVASIWYGVDPLAEKYVEISAYVYCHGNPIRLVDPDGCYDIQTNVNAKNATDYKIVAVFQSQYKEEDGSDSEGLQNDVKAALESNVCVVFVDDIADCYNAFERLSELEVAPDVITLNSHGLPGAFKIGYDIIHEKKDLSLLANHPLLEKSTIFIGACNVGKNSEGDALLKSMYEQLEVPIVAALHSIIGGYRYDGSYELNNPVPDIDGNSDKFKIIQKNNTPIKVRNVTIDSKEGLKWEDLDKF